MYADLFCYWEQLTHPQRVYIYIYANYLLYKSEINSGLLLIAISVIIALIV